MIQARIDAFQSNLEHKTRDEIIDYAVYYFAESGRLSEELDQLKGTWDEMIVQFQQMKDELAGARSEIRTLRELNCHLTGVREIQNNNLFGRSTEKAEALFRDAMRGTPETDPLSEDASPDAASSESTAGPDRSPCSCGHGKGSGAAKTKGKRDRDLEKLPKQVLFEYDINEINRTHGEHNWRFAFWQMHRTVECVRSFTYLRVVYTPVISCGLEHTLTAIPYDRMLLPKSLVSPSLLATIMTEKFGLYLPVNRQVQDPGHFGFPLSRQTPTNWIVKLSLELLKPVVKWLKETLLSYSYHQCDETTYLVIHSGKAPGAKGFIWVHRSSSLSDVPQIILYVYENSRSAEHLRSFFGELSSHIHLSCDAYSAYHAFEKDDPKNITLCGCFMHARRRFAEALWIRNTKGLSEEQTLSLPEAVAINLLKEIYHEEHGLRFLSAEERLAARIKKIRPLVDQFFDFIRGLDLSDPTYSDKLKEAILYSRNQETQLRKFLTDGNIPIDNGVTERSVKPIALGRKNYLFSNTLAGAEAATIITSLIETAKANGAEPYYYLKYLLELMPKHVRQNIPIPDKQILAPWSEAYRNYEFSEKQTYLDSLKAPPGNEKPRTPRKRDPIPLQNTA